MPGERSGIRFIHSHKENTPGVTSAETRRRLHSDAARATHAKRRRQRMIEHQTTVESRDGWDGGQIPGRQSAEVQVAVVSSPIGPLGSSRRDPFASFARRFSPIEDFLLDYYVSNFVPCSSTCANSQTDRHLNNQFVQLAATSGSALNGLFLVASRHLSLCLPQWGPHFTQLALQCKVACARLLAEAISFSEMRSPISDSTITIATLVGDVISTQRHLQGAVQMVRHNGALDKKGFNEFLYSLIQNDIAQSNLVRAAAPFPSF
ncbi:hypothetical protein CSOJ01_14313 [Colletotrichum sojae]|uniref:Uncharacterized protein n=1 Tax=Colletotrichum sojae TaxID=2175907 RepID=A0A8H6IQT6_9PEZI|nr:hypothetical protein CSOJ01_14313 [Colletotrichum sojae]